MKLISKREAAMLAKNAKLFLDEGNSMNIPTTDLSKKIEIELAKLAKLDEQIGRLMSKRVSVEEALAVLIGLENQRRAS